MCRCFLLIVFYKYAGKLIHWNAIIWLSLLLSMKCKPDTVSLITSFPLLFFTALLIQHKAIIVWSFYGLFNEGVVLMPADIHWGGAISGNLIRHSDVLPVDSSFAEAACFLHCETISMNFSELTPCPRSLSRPPCLFESALIKVYLCGIVSLLQVHCGLQCYRSWTQIQ